jgi:anti-sigma-K factor RskA
MNDLSPIEALAADYVLGQLDKNERSVVAARLQREPALKAAVEAWERRLAPLGELAPAVAPSPNVLAAIEAKIGARPQGADTDGNVVDLTRRLRRWRTATGLAGALAASLVIALMVREIDRPPTGGNLVAVLQKDAASPAFVLTVDLTSKSFTVRSVAPERQTDKSYELWLVSDKLPAPRSLGLVGQSEFDTRRALAGYDAATIANATFAVSVEPKGGSPTGAPTGAVVYAGKLIQATR